MRSILVFALCLLLTGLGAPAEVSAQSIPLGWRHLENEQYGQARRVFQALAQGAPSALHQFQLGQFYLAVHQPDSARAAFQQGLTLDPKSAINQVGLGEVEVVGNNLVQAGATFDQAKRSTRSRDAQVFYWIGRAYMQHEHQDLDKAIEALEKAVSLNNQNADFYTTLGQAYLAKKDGSKAARNFEQARYFNAKQVQAFLGLGDIYQLAKNYTEALRVYQEGYQADSTYLPLNRALGEIYFLARQYGNAVRYYGRYVDGIDPNPEARFTYAGYLFLNKDYAAAIAELKSLENRVSNVALHRILGYSYYETQDLASGLTQMQTFFTKAKPDEVLMSDHEYLGKMLIETGQDTLAGIAEWRMVMEADTSKWAMHKDIADMMFRSRRYAEAAQEYETMSSKGMKLSGTDYLRMGQAYYSSRDYKRADSSLAFVNTVATTSIPGWLWRGRASARLDTSQVPQGFAKPYYEKVVELATDPARYKRELVEANYYLGSYYYLNEDRTNAETYLRAVVGLEPTHPNANAMLNAMGIKVEPPPQQPPPPQGEGSGNR
jgi:tetratricopeptide (TPR) repeat protein